MALLSVTSQASHHTKTKRAPTLWSWFVLAVLQLWGVGHSPPPVHPLPVKFNSLSLQRPALAWTLVHTHAQDEPTGYLLVRGKGRGGPSHPFFPSIKCRGHYVVATLTPLFICETKPPTHRVRCINSGEDLSLPDLGVRTAPGFALLWQLQAWPFVHIQCTQS